MEQESRRAIGFTPMETRRTVIVELAYLADSLGYEAVLVPEGWGLDSTAVLAEISITTERIRPMSSILSIWGRTPATIAMSTATLNDLSSGRYALGLGVSTAAIAEGFHDVEFTRPAEKLADVTRQVRTLLLGERAPLERSTEARPLRLGQDATPDQDIYLAAMGPRTKRATAELADGWMPAFIARDQLADQTAELLDIRRDAENAPETFTVVGNALGAVADDPEQARLAAASTLAWYICAMGDVYARLISEQGYAAEVEAVIEANPKPNPTRCVVPPEAERLLDQYVVFGDDAGLATMVSAWDEVCDIATVGMPPGAPQADLERIVYAAAPSQASAALREPK